VFSEKVANFKDKIAVPLPNAIVVRKEPCRKKVSWQGVVVANYALCSSSKDTALFVNATTR